MKSVKNVFDKIHNKEHIKDVLMQSLKGKKYAKRHKEHIDELVDYTYEHMEFQNYDLKPKTKMIIHDRKKDREITKSPYFPNKMYDYMIVSGIKETLEKSMYKWSVGNIKGRGKDMGISYLEKHIRGYKYALHQRDHAGCTVNQQTAGANLCGGILFFHQNGVFRFYANLNFHRKPPFSYSILQIPISVNKNGCYFSCYSI